MKDQFNGDTEKRRPPPHLKGHEVYEMVKDVHVILRLKMSMLSLVSKKGPTRNTEEDNMWKNQSIFWELPYWKDLDIHHSIDVMYVKKNVCESLLRTLLNTNRKTRGHGYARADLKNEN
jgi:hypothetical protein